MAGASLGTSGAAPAAKPWIWDSHCHLQLVEGGSIAERAANLMRIAERMEIERCILLGPVSNLPASRDKGPDASYDPSPESLKEQNDAILTALSGWDHRASGWVYVNPNHAQASLDEINRCVRDGPMVGLKLWVATRCNSPLLDPLVRRAVELKAPFFQHTWMKRGGTGNLPGESTVHDLADLARRHPDATIICGHAGGAWEWGIRAVRPLRNVSVDLSGSDATAGFTEMAVRELGPERVLYGSDVGGRSFASQLGKVLGADIPESAKRLILRDNLKRLLSPILEAKGVRIDAGVRQPDSLPMRDPFRDRRSVRNEQGSP